MALFDQFSIEFSLIRNELAKKISAVSSPFNQNMLGACIHQNIRSLLCNYQCCSVNIRCYPMLFISTKKTASHFFPPFASSVVCLCFFLSSVSNFRVIVIVFTHIKIGIEQEEPEIGYFSSGRLFLTIGLICIRSYLRYRSMCSFLSAAYLPNNNRGDYLAWQDK